jgi:hypothetical protein
MMEAAALSPESEKERLQGCVSGLINNQMESFIHTQMSEERNKNPRTMHKGKCETITIAFGSCSIKLKRRRR